MTLSNFLTSDDSADFSYITKRWNSGVTEIYVYIPTTNTYYIAHAGSESGCGVPLSVAYRRQNIAADFGLSASVIDSDIPSHTSRFQIKVSDAVYGMDGLMEVQANGNSLPLKIYRD